MIQTLTAKNIVERIWGVAKKEKNRDRGQETRHRRGGQHTEPLQERAYRLLRYVYCRLQADCYGIFCKAIQRSGLKLFAGGVGRR